MLQHAVTSGDYVLAPLGQVFRDLKAKLMTQFIQDSVVHTPRECNKPAHVLASFGAGLATGASDQWFDNYPDIVTRAVTGDLAVS